MRVSGCRRLAEDSSTLAVGRFAFGSGSALNAARACMHRYGAPRATLIVTRCALVSTPDAPLPPRLAPAPEDVFALLDERWSGSPASLSGRPATSDSDTSMGSSERTGGHTSPSGATGSHGDMREGEDSGCEDGAGPDVPADAEGLGIEDEEDAGHWRQRYYGSSDPEFDTSSEEASADGGDGGGGGSDGADDADDGGPGDSGSSDDGTRAGSANFYAANRHSPIVAASPITVAQVWLALACQAGLAPADTHVAALAVLAADRPAIDCAAVGIPAFVHEGCVASPQRRIRHALPLAE